MARWVGFIPLELVVRDLKLCSNRDMWSAPWLVEPIVSDRGIRLARNPCEVRIPVGPRTGRGAQHSQRQNTQVRDRYADMSFGEPAAWVPMCVAWRVHG